MQSLKRKEKADELIRGMAKDTLIWYPFEKGKKALCVDSDNYYMEELLREKGLEVTTICVEKMLENDFLDTANRMYDYVVGIEVIECCSEPVKLLCNMRKALKVNGRLLLGTENRLGLRYFCGDYDHLSGEIFDGVENYHRTNLQERSSMDKRSYSAVEIENFLSEAKLENFKRYSIFPNLHYPQMLLAKDYFPKENLELRIIPRYEHKESVFLREEYLYGQFVENKTLHEFANAYLFECINELNADKAEFAKALQVTLSADRGKERGLATIIRDDEKVEKRALFAEGISHIHALMEHDEDLKSHGIPIVAAKLVNDTYVMPFVNAGTAQLHLQKLLTKNKEAFIHEIDVFREYILKSSESVETVDEMMPEEQCYRRAYIDLVPLNAFYIEGKYLFYDQEFYMENYPINVVVMRMVDLIYRGHPELEKILPREFFLERYGLLKNRDQLMHYSAKFMVWLRNLDTLKAFRAATEQDTETLNANRLAMNYSAGEYKRLFVDIFDGLENRKLILFGSGKYAYKFIELFGDEYEIKMLLDNNAEHWGKLVEGIRIAAPTELNEIDAEQYKIIICMKNFVPVLKQLNEMGVKHYGIYTLEFERPREELLKRRRINYLGYDGAQKKYHIGYVAGVFDLFHIGHLNLLRRAKEQCDYLIVGVVSDEGVRKNKHTEPFIHFEERLEMVRACKYVDEAVKIPLLYCDTADAYRKFRFDVQFSGSDYEHSAAWLNKQAFLRSRGSEMVLFPYTESTSSTKIKGLIDRKLM